MDHEFHVGETCRNRFGQYTVLEIRPPKMRIRYENGAEQMVDIAVQASIWERQHMERASPEGDGKESSKTKSVAKRPSTTFQGLEESDFKNNVTGTTWRSRGKLGGLVASDLTALNHNKFVSFSIYRQPWFFVFSPEFSMNRQPEGINLPKFIVRLNPLEVRYGFYIERPDDLTRSYWPRFLDLLSDTEWQHRIQAVAEAEELRWVLRLEGRDAPTGEEVISPALPSGLLDRLRGVPDELWCNLYLVKSMEKQKAIGMGAGISVPISHTFNALAPMYWRLRQR